MIKEVFGYLGGWRFRFKYYFNLRVYRYKRLSDLEARTRDRYHVNRSDPNYRGFLVKTLWMWSDNLTIEECEEEVMHLLKDAWWYD